MTTASERLALNTYVKLMRATESLTSRAHRHLASAGLTMSQFGVLEALLHLGSLSQKEIGRKLLRSGGNITMVVDNLAKRGLVKRRRKAEDRRVYMIHLTEDGRRLMDKVFPRHAAAVTEEMKVLSPEEQITLGKLCKKLGLKNHTLI